MLEQCYPGVWKVVLGQPETVTPTTERHFDPADEPLAHLPESEAPAVVNQIIGQQTARGYQIYLPLSSNEQLYGLGLQLRSFNQRGHKKTLRVNSDPIADLGDSHAPVPFYASTAGYGVLVDTARYTTFYCGSAQPRFDRRTRTPEAGTTDYGIALSAEELYARQQNSAPDKVIIDIPAAAGATVYIFAGPDMRTAIQRYNLFSGGGCLPSRWGLGVWYRCRADFSQDQVVAMAQEFRDEAMPCEVLGLEPKWQTQAYSCSFVWNRQLFPNPKSLVDTLKQSHFHVNLWTHVFTHPESPIYGDLLPYSGNYEVFSKGLVPDLTIPRAREIFADFHDQEHVALGISGYKLDECDNSDFISFQWSFPEISQFPSDTDGEQMHSLLGLQYQYTINSIFRKRNQRTYSEVRSSHALAAPYPFVLYSDLYEFSDFLHGLVNCGFSGLLWCPEVRHATSTEDLIRRIQMVMLSPQALINAWYIKNTPWKQWRREENNDDVLLDNWQQIEDICRGLFQLRMRFIPYLYSAFFTYASSGLPPFRALVMDYPDDEKVWTVDNQFMMGDRVMVAPIAAGSTERDIYLPAGEWVDFWSGERFVGGQSIHRAVPLEQIPIFVKDGSVLPLATPTLHTDDPQSYALQVQVYGNGSLPAELIEDDGETFAYEQGEFNQVQLVWNAETGTGILTRDGQVPCPQYTAATWEHR